MANKHTITRLVHKYGSKKWMRVSLLFYSRTKGHRVMCMKQHTHTQFLFPEYLLVVRAIYATRHVYKNKQQPNLLITYKYSVWNNNLSLICLAITFQNLQPLPENIPSGLILWIFSESWDVLKNILSSEMQKNGLSKPVDRTHISTPIATTKWKKEKKKQHNCQTYFSLLLSCHSGVCMYMFGWLCLHTFVYHFARWKTF